MKHTEIETKQLLQMYANANTTCGQCGGHYKGDKNAAARREFAEELEKRGIIVPKTLQQILDKSFRTNVKIPEGVFNGQGAY